jgi:GNAT superfamily N-acetyltransferase
VKLLFRLAVSRGDVLRCRRVAAEVYNRDYEVVFSEDHYDLEAKIEPWPHRFLMAWHGDELVAACGLYMRDTYVEKFGQVSDDEVAALVEAGGATGAYDVARKREQTKLSVLHRWRGHGIAQWLLAAAHSRHFTEVDQDRALMVFCSKRSIVRNLYDRAGVRTRLIKAFPFYKVHELYRSPDDPMESRLIIPELDIPEHWYDLALPGEYDVARMPHEGP